MKSGRRTKEALSPRPALSADLGIGLLLPCDVAVYDNGDGTSSIKVMDPDRRWGRSATNRTGAVACDARARLRRVLDALKG